MVQGYWWQKCVTLSFSNINVKKKERDKCVKTKNSLLLNNHNGKLLALVSQKLCFYSDKTTIIPWACSGEEAGLCHSPSSLVPEPMGKFSGGILGQK